jgi:orotate phosphoribosyltransferase
MNTEEIFKKSGPILEGHFLLTSGLHSPVYWEKFHVLQHPRYTEQLCSLISQHFAKSGIEIVAGPTTGGIILAHEVGRQLNVRACSLKKKVKKGLSDAASASNRGREYLLSMISLLQANPYARF